MNAPTQSVARRAAGPDIIITAAWRPVLLSLGLGLLLLGALFHREVAAAVQTWAVSTAYNHCFLVIPITLYLLWDRRDAFSGLPPRPMPQALLLGVPLALLWLAVERLGIMEGRQLVAISFVELLFLAILGPRLWWAMAGPLLYLYFLVPFGEFLTPRLQDITTWFIRHGLEILQIPAFIDGYIIEIPQGTFFVAEACAGLRFLIASIAFGCLYALMMYRSPVRRAVFIGVALIVPVIANGFRGLGIVYLGYLLGSAQAAAADHIIYGWIFFSAVILVLIALGLPFRQDGAPPQAARSSDLSAGPPTRPNRMLAIALGVVAAAAVSPAVAAALTMGSAGEAPAPARIDVGPDCDVHPADAAKADAKADRDTLRVQRVVCDGVTMDMRWQTFPSRITAGPLMAARRELVLRAETEGLQMAWLDAEHGTHSAWRLMASTEPAFAIAVAIWVDGKPVRPGLAMRGRMALDSLVGSSVPPMVLTVTPVVDWASLNENERKDAMDSLTAFLLRHHDLNPTVRASP